jgi:outer membrane protein assembly factor BamB
MRRTLLILMLAALVVACSKTKNVHLPKKLVPFTASMRVERVWTASVGGTRKPLLLGLGLAVRGNRVYAAGYGGKVAAFDLESGRRLWERRVRVDLGGGPAADASLVVVGSLDGDVFALDAATGKVRWHVDIAGEILAAAAVTPKIIVVRAVDGTLHALSPADGRELWQVQQSVPALSLRGTSSPVVVGNFVVCGFDNGTVVDANLSDGSSVWEQQISTPHGSNAIEQLNDVDATPRALDGDVYVAQYQGRVAMLGLNNGQIWWSHKMSSYRGMGIDAHNVYVSTSDGEVVAMLQRNGGQLWQQDALMYRRLSTPAVSDDAVVVADYQGYVHWLDKATGAFLARVRASHKSIINAPVAADGLVLVIDDEGHISAFRATPLKGAPGRR